MNRLHMLLGAVALYLIFMHLSSRDSFEGTEQVTSTAIVDDYIKIEEDFNRRIAAEQNPENRKALRNQLKAIYLDFRKKAAESK